VVTPTPTQAPEPTAAVPAAASVAESVLLDHPDPRLTQPVTASEPSQKVVAPELQPEAAPPEAPKEPEEGSKDDEPEAPKP
jgi:hypothetical protein